MSPRNLQRALLPAAVLALACGACGGDGDDKRPAGTPAARSPARTVAATAVERPSDVRLRLVALDPVNGSGVSGTARLMLKGRNLSVEAVVAGAEHGREHLQHVHLPPGSEDGVCPTPDLDRDGDGLVSLEEGAPAYGAPAVSLEPFPKRGRFEYVRTLTVAPGLALDRGVLVLHGMTVDGKYDPLMPVACAAIDDTWVRETALEPVNQSGIAGTARLALADEHRLVVWASLGGSFDGRRHMQHIHLPEGDAQGSCPTEALDRNQDGLVSLEEGTPAYGDPAVSLEPFPRPKGVLFDYMRTLAVEDGAALERGVVVVHGMEVDGEYDPTIPVACGPIDPTLPRSSLTQPPSTASGTRAHGYDLGEP